jgi:hypothetical protein
MMAATPMLRGSHRKPKGSSMLYIDQQKHIKNRADFFRALAAAIQGANDLLKVAPGDGSVTSILRQLEMIRTWTENGRQPTKEERWKPKIGLQLSREFDGVSEPRISAWVELTGEVAAYFRHWLDDVTYQTVDEDDVPYFPEDENDVTHLLV